MDIFAQIANYQPQNPQEKNDQQVMVEAIRQYPHNILLRKNKLAHLTSSAFVVNPARNKALLVHHNILNTWVWPGGHADGDADLLAVALREAKEETGVCQVKPLLPTIAALDILPVPAHIKNGQYVNAHLHLSVAYILVCDEAEAVQIKPDENTGVRWFTRQQFTPTLFNPADFSLYNKLLNRANHS
ncbi:NUDIX hydrolase [Ruminococcaceae bacterium OttesenSCG-928-A16]|nr:NUDIX hydrolase [Ruminococcaceae bacterium OttesenSCG-928-A16]